MRVLHILTYLFTFLQQSHHHLATGKIHAPSFIHSSSMAPIHHTNLLKKEGFEKHVTSSSSGSTSIFMSVPYSHQIIQTAVGIILAKKMGNGGYKRGSLNKSGSIAAFVVGSLAFSSSLRCGATMFCFYLTSSKLTKVGSDIKKKIEEKEDEDESVPSSGKKKSGGGNRGATQVLACSLFGVLASFIRRVMVGVDGPLDYTNLTSLGNRLTLCVVAFFACCAGDTWASELGVLSKSSPRLVTMPWKVAAPGTNGAVSLVGTLASAAGGLCMGLCHAMFLLVPLSPRRDYVTLATVGLVCGVGGSLLDSVLGATVQATYYDVERKIIVKRPSPTTERRGGLPFLSNEVVNIVSTIITALVAALFPLQSGLLS